MFNYCQRRLETPFLSIHNRIVKKFDQNILFMNKMKAQIACKIAFSFSLYSYNHLYSEVLNTTTTYMDNINKS